MFSSILIVVLFYFRLQLFLLSHVSWVESANDPMSMRRGRVDIEEHASSEVVSLPNKTGYGLEDEGSKTQTLASSNFYTKSM